MSDSIPIKNPFHKLEGYNCFGCAPGNELGLRMHFRLEGDEVICDWEPETVDLLYQNGLISNLADLYQLKKEQLTQLERMGEKSADRILKSLEDSRTVPFGRVLYALGIRFVGETIAKNLAAAAGNIDALLAMTREELTSINEIGDKIAVSVTEYFLDPRHLLIIARLKESGIRFESEQLPEEAVSDKLAGLSIVISGTFIKHSRDELKVLIEVNGGKNVSSISKNTSYILAGENMGPSKLEKAKQLKVPLISEDEFLKMIE